ncbi:MAG: host attachment protein [Novosphingobium sp.]|nr:host attachment protein [Novosphingobium sp.]
MLLPHGTVFALVDGERFELYRNSGMEAEPKLTALPTPELEETNKSAGMRHHANTRDPSDDRLDEDAHAIAVADWLNDQAITNKLEKLVIIADPRSLGEMRKRYHKELKSVLIGELDRTLTGSKPDAIVKALRAVD